MRNPSLLDALELLAHFVIFCVGEVILWAWALGNVPFAVVLAGHAVAVFVLMNSLILGVSFLLYSLARLKMAWRRFDST